MLTISAGYVEAEVDEVPLVRRGLTTQRERRLEQPGRSESDATIICTARRHVSTHRGCPQSSRLVRNLAHTYAIAPL
jgi:hypothetical protein